MPSQPIIGDYLEIEGDRVFEGDQVATKHVWRSDYYNHSRTVVI
jgi:hypothetical protein